MRQIICAIVRCASLRTHCHWRYAYYLIWRVLYFWCTSISLSLSPPCVCMLYFAPFLYCCTIWMKLEVYTRQQNKTKHILAMLAGWLAGWLDKVGPKERAHNTPAKRWNRMPIDGCELGILLGEHIYRMQRFPRFILSMIEEHADPRIYSVVYLIFISKNV